MRDNPICSVDRYKTRQTGGTIFEKEEYRFRSNLRELGKGCYGVEFKKSNTNFIIDINDAALSQWFCLGIGRRKQR